MVAAVPGIGDAVVIDLGVVPSALIRSHARVRALFESAGHSVIVQEDPFDPGCIPAELIHVGEAVVMLVKATESVLPLKQGLCFQEDVVYFDGLDFNISAGL